MKTYLVTDYEPVQEIEIGLNIQEVEMDINGFPDNTEYVTSRVVRAPTAFEAVSIYCEDRVGNSLVVASEINRMSLFVHTQAIPESIKRMP